MHSGIPRDNVNNGQIDWWNKMWSLGTDICTYGSLVYNKGDITDQWGSNGFLGRLMAN